MHILWSV